MVQRATLTQVAQRAGVSIASASRALNGLVASPATVEKVRRAADDLGYVPDASARALKMGSTGQLTFAVDDIGNPVYVEMMTGVQEVVAAGGYRLQVTSTGATSGPHSVLDLIRNLRRGYADGLILSPLRVTPELLAELAATPVPVVVIGRLPQHAGVDTVMTDSALGVALAVEHLHAQGRRRIAFLNGPGDTTPGAARRRGFDEAVAAHPDVVASTHEAVDFTMSAGREAAHRLLDPTGRSTTAELAASPGTPDAVVAANDLLAIGALHAAHDLGLDVPGRLAVTGVDDTSLTEIVHPSLTSVSLASRRRGQLAAELLMRRLEDPARAPQVLSVPPLLQVRGSSTTTAGIR
ncbi:LacI family transcriptional regulator [Serinibacter arcticus]|uniref:LacI family transcriptional regulator n=1 Tax=Serinibacter arcticus TaxID=1655435 RepID=A0A2U1ZV23_9MICO|nr:LacI family DNA-binding transcriptional regulator [Serinibacter arcticus]PWD50828.1 LacI family transcriptional regulator [Serinibacter arcticus]